MDQPQPGQRDVQRPLDGPRLPRQRGAADDGPGGDAGQGDEHGEMMSILQESVSGIRLVKSFRGEPYEDNRFTRASDSYAAGAARITRVAFLSQPLTELIGTTIAVLILWIGARQALGAGGISGAPLRTMSLSARRDGSVRSSFGCTPRTRASRSTRVSAGFGVVEAGTGGEALRLAAQKLPVKTKFVVARDYEAV